jgi:hypothetical protein
MEKVLYKNDPTLVGKSFAAGGDADGGGCRSSGGEGGYDDADDGDV